MIMKQAQILILGFTLMLLLGCSNKDNFESLKEDCSRIRDGKIFLKEEGCCLSFGYAVYRFENELYTVQGDCSCPEFLCFPGYKPTNCEGIALCDNEEGWENIQNCIREMQFYENAEHLFNVSI